MVVSGLLVLFCGLWWLFLSKKFVVFFFDLLVVVVLLGVEVCVGSSGFLYAFINRHTHRFNNTKKFLLKSFIAYKQNISFFF